ncbi:MAG: TolC family protein [Gemmatimonadota bacterium]
MSSPFALPHPVVWLSVGLLSMTAVVSPAAHAQDVPLTLAAAASAALETGPALAAAKARREGADADQMRAAAARLPSLQLDGSLTRFQEPMVVAPLHSFDPSRPPRFDETLVQGAARIRYTAFDGGARGARLQGARSGVVAAEASVEARRMDVLQQVTAAYLDVLAARAQQDAARRREEALQAESERARRTVASGSAAELEALRASAALEEARADAATSGARRELAERSLARLIGRPADAVVGRPLTDVRLAESVGDPVRSGSHPELARALEAVRAAEARVGEQRAARLPRLDVTAGLLDYGTATGGHTTEWQAGVAVTWPLFTGGARTAAVRRAEADAVAARAEREAAARSLEAATDEARAAVTEADARAQALTASVAQWEEVTRIEALALEAGAGVQSDLLMAEASLFRSRAGLARARYDRLLARVRLARALGTLDRDWLGRTLEVDG